jgi:hypothetical protein
MGAIDSKNMFHPQIIEYNILRETDHITLIKLVNLGIKNNYQPFGSLVITKGSMYTYYNQAMVKMGFLD